MKPYGKCDEYYANGASFVSIVQSDGEGKMVVRAGLAEKRYVNGVEYGHPELSTLPRVDAPRHNETSEQYGRRTGCNPLI